MKRAVSVLFMLGLSLACVSTAAAQPAPVHPQPAVMASAPSHTPAVPAPMPDLRWNLLGLAVMIGATRKVNLSKTYLFNGETFGPGTNVVVPDDFPDLDDKGDPIYEEGSAAARNQERDRRMSSPPSTGGVDTGEGRTPPAGATAELEAMTKADLQAMAEKKGIVVDRQDEDGNIIEGEPLKADYVRALS